MIVIVSATACKKKEYCWRCEGAQETKSKTNGTLKQPIAIQECGKTEDEMNAIAADRSGYDTSIFNAGTAGADTIYYYTTFDKCNKTEK